VAAFEGSTVRGRPVIAVIAVVWVGLGLWAIKDGDMWRGAAGVALGALSASTYLWPDSRVTAFLEKPIVRRKKGAEQVGTPDQE
jgi:hypothetical protein